MNFNLDKLLKIPLLKGEKKPAVKNWNLLNNNKIDTSKYDIGIITGEKNNIIVLDIDNKDDGLNEFLTYLKNEKNPFNYTFGLKTPSGGFHLYFQYNSDNANLNNLIKLLKNKSKYRNKGLDIRTNGGYVKFYGDNIFLDKDNKPLKILEMNEEFILFLLEFENKRASVIIKKDENKYIFNITIEEIRILLFKLPFEYYTNFYNWYIILNICKNLKEQFYNIYDIFNEFSKQCAEKYDAINNKEIWNTANLNININYITNVLKINQIEFYKKEEEQTINNVFLINEPFLKFDDKFLFENDTIIIKSITGTGKTTKTANFLYKFQQQNENTKFLSIVNLRKLNEQQLKTFCDENNEIYGYLDIENQTLKNTNNIICCLNSLLKLNWLYDDDEIKNYFVYMDEITTLIETLLFSDTLNKNLKAIYNLFCYIVKNCKKLIVSDAFINNNVFNLLSLRKNKQIIIQNNYQKYKNIEANNIQDENEFLRIIKEHIIFDNYFLFGSDSKKQIEKYINILLENDEIKLKKDKFLIITADTNIKITDAETQFKNKFVFYSPSITTGVNFTIDKKQDVFIFINGNTISPLLSFQQATRTRNINKLYYFSKVKSKQAKYITIDDVEKDINEKFEIHCNLINLCIDTGEDGEKPSIKKNLFYKMYIDGLYLNDIYATNKLLHFENILKNEGFKIVRHYDKINLEKEINKKALENLKSYNEEQIKNFLEDIKNNIIKDEYKHLIDRIKYLKIKKVELEKYIYIIADNFKYQAIFNLHKCFYTDDALKFILGDGEKEQVKILDNVAAKILLLRKLENEFKIKPFEINSLTASKIDEKLYKEIIKVFKFERTKKPNTTNILKSIYFTMLKNIVAPLKIISSKPTTNKYNKKINIYNYNIELIKNILELINKQENNLNYDEELLKIFGIEIKCNEMTYKFGIEK